MSGQEKTASRHSENSQPYSWLYHRSPNALRSSAKNCGDLHSLPIAFAVPFVMEPAAFAKRRGQGRQPSLANSQHRTHGAVKGVIDPRRLVDDEQGHATET